MEHRISYVARLTNNAAGINGNSWLVATLPYLSFSTVLVDGHAQDVAMVQDQKLTTFFGWSSAAGQYQGLYGTRRTLNGTSGVDYSVSDARGKKWVFYGPGAVAGLVGKLQSWTDPSGIVTTATYDGYQKLAYLERQLPGTGFSAGLYFTFAQSGVNQGRILTVEKRISRDGVAQPVKRWTYAYHGGEDSAGSANDLKTALLEVYNNQSGKWESLGTSYYRYYTADSPTGFKYGLKYVVDPAAYARMIAAGFPPENTAAAPDEMLAAYATEYREYNAQHRTTKLVTRGGSTVRLFSYVSSTGTRNWKLSTTETRPDGAQFVTYSNYTSQPLLSILKQGGQSWPQSNNYTEYRLTGHAGPDCVASFSEPMAPDGDFSVALQATQGLYRVWSYYPLSGGGAGSAPGFLQWEAVQQGSASVTGPIMQYALTYVSQTVGDQTAYRVASRTNFRGDQGTGNPILTAYAYEWNAGTLTPLQRITTLPVVPTIENGTGETYTQVERYDNFENILWSKDEIGVLTYLVFDPLTGGAVQTVIDVDTTRIDPAVVPAGWSTPSGAGLHLIYDFESDSLGRCLLMLGPLDVLAVDGEAIQARRASYWAFFDERLQQWSAQGYAAGGAYRTVGPVTGIQRNYSGQATDFVKAAFPCCNRIGSSAIIPQRNWTFWTHRVYDKGNRLSATRDYFNIPASEREVDGNPAPGFEGTDYRETRYGYNSQNRQCQATSPGGTIVWKVLDPRGLVLQVWMGTDASGGTDLDPSGGGAVGNNMVQTEINTYDEGGADQPGRWLSTTRPVDSNASHDIVTSFQNDFRGRRTMTTMNDGTYTLLRVYVLNNFDDIVYDTLYKDMPDFGHMLAYRTNSYDGFKRVFNSKEYGVSTSGGPIGNPLNSDFWFDPRGLPIKSAVPGFNGYIKVHYDSVSRSAIGYLAYPQTGGLSGNSNDVSEDIVLEQAVNAYSNTPDVISTSLSERLDDATGVGPLNTPTGSQPQARISYAGLWRDALGRVWAEANYGTNGGAPFARPALPPAPSDVVLVSYIHYAESAEANETVEPDGVITRWKNDRLGRNICKWENFIKGCNGGKDSASRITEFQYAPDGGTSVLLIRNAVGGDQVTRWIYGTTLQESGVARSDLVRAKVYPLGVDEKGDIVSDTTYRYNRQARSVAMTDENGTSHTFVLDKFSRVIQDQVPTVGTNIDPLTRCIAKVYNERGLLTKVGSYDNPNPAIGMLLNEVQFGYNGYNQLSTDAQSHTGAVGPGTPTLSYGYADGSSNTIRRTSVTYPSGAVVQLGYGAAGSADDRLDRLAQVSIAGEAQALCGFTWAGVGRFVQLQMPQPGLALTYKQSAGSPVGDGGDPYSGYDRFGRTVDMQWLRLSTSSSVSRIQYGYNRASRRLWRQDLAAPALSAQDRAWGYDALGRSFRDSGET